MPHISIRQRIKQWIIRQPAENPPSQTVEEDQVNYSDRETIQTCPVCFMVPKYPVIFRNCHKPHFVCSECYTQLWKTKNTDPVNDNLIQDYIFCPICRDKVYPCRVYGLRDLVTYYRDLDIVKFFSLATIPCSRDGCPEKAIPLRDISYHEMKICTKRLFHCPSLQCKELVEASQLENHITNCPDMVSHYDLLRFSRSSHSDPFDKAVQYAYESVGRKSVGRTSPFGNYISSIRPAPILVPEAIRRMAYRRTGIIQLYERQNAQ